MHRKVALLMPLLVYSDALHRILCGSHCCMKRLSIQTGHCTMLSDMHLKAVLPMVMSDSSTTCSDSHTQKTSTTIASYTHAAK